MSTDSDTSTSSTFQGFDVPRQNWFKMPNNWTDITADISSIAELKVVEYVLKHTWGYQEYGVRKRITNDEFMNGRRRKDGSRIDKGTGLSKPSVISGLKSAIERGLLIEEVDDSDRARVKKYYSLRMLPDLQDELEGDVQPSNPPDTGEEAGVKDLNAGVKNFYPEVKTFNPRGKKSLPRTEKDTLARNSKQDTEKNNNNNDGATDQNVVVAFLIQQGIAKKVAHQLANRYSQEYIFEKAEFLDYLREAAPEKIKTPQGWLRKAIEEDYAAPDGYESPAARAAKAAEAQQQAEKVKQAIEAQQEYDQEKRKQRQQQAAAQLASLQAQYGTTQDELDLWNQIVAEFKSNMSAAAFQMYVANTVLLSLRDGEALIGLPNKLTREWVENRLADKIRRTLSSYLGGQKVMPKFVDLVSIDAAHGYIEQSYDSISDQGS